MEAGIIAATEAHYIETDIWVKDTDKPGYLKKVRDKTIAEVFEEVKARLISQGLYKKMDYFTISWPDKDGEKPLNEYRWIACFAVDGGSEGHYIHVETISSKDETRKLLYLGKTFGGMAEALEIANALTKMFYGER